MRKYVCHPSLLLSGTLKEKQKKTTIGFARQTHIHSVKQTVHIAVESALCEQIFSLEKGIVKKNKQQFPFIITRILD